ncbi:hypothetical protein ACFU89_34180, partial [Priestia megaterium]
MTNEDFKYLNKHLETLSELKQSGYPDTLLVVP